MIMECIQNMKEQIFGLKKKFYPNGKIKGVHSNEMGIRWNEDGTVSSIYYNKDDNNGISVSNNIDGTSRVFIRIDGEEAKGKFDEKFLFMKEKKIVLSETLPLNNPDTRNGYNKVYYPNGKYLDRRILCRWKKIG